MPDCVPHATELLCGWILLTLGHETERLACLRQGANPIGVDSHQIDHIRQPQRTTSADGLSGLHQLQHV